MLIIGSHFYDPDLRLDRAQTATRLRPPLRTPGNGRSDGRLAMTTEAFVTRRGPLQRQAVRNARAVDDRLREMAPVVKLARENITRARAL